jgi:hypothetical protein
MQEVKKRKNKRDSNGLAHGLWRYWIYTTTIDHHIFGKCYIENYVHGEQEGEEVHIEPVRKGFKK